MLLHIFHRDKERRNVLYCKWWCSASFVYCRWRRKCNVQSNARWDIRKWRTLPVCLPGIRMYIVHVSVPVFHFAPSISLGKGYNLDWNLMKSGYFMSKAQHLSTYTINECIHLAVDNERHTYTHINTHAYTEQKCLQSASDRIMNVI